MTERNGGDCGAWLHGWQAMPALPADEQAAGAAHAQVRALDGVAKSLQLDDEPWRLRVALARAAKR